MIRLALALVLLAACSKDKEAPAESARGKVVDMPVVTGAPIGGYDIEKAGMLLGETVKIFQKNGANCAQLGTDLAAFVTKNADALKALDEAEQKLSDADRETMQEKTKASFEAAMTLTEAGRKACGTDARVQAALAPLVSDPK